jgi:ABC-2 type transport system ATP-binding protein
MIEVRDLTKHYGPASAPIKALQGITLDIERGEVVGLLGPNGAGKSTAMRVITGYLAPTSGGVRVDGIDVLDDPKACQARIGYLPEGNPLYLDMRLREALTFTASARGLTGDARRTAIAAALDDAGLLGRERQLIGSLSRGYKQRVGLAMALLHRPPILILDEPTSGLDPNQQTEMRKFVRSLAQDHTVVFSSHILPEVEAVCDRVIAIHQGRVVADGTVEDVRLQATGGRIVYVTARGDAAALEASLGSLTFVQSIETSVDPSDRSLATAHLRVGNHPAVDACEAAGRAVFEAGLGVVGLATERASLEDAFAALTPDDADDIGPREPQAVPPPLPGPDAAASTDGGGDDVA